MKFYYAHGNAEIEAQIRETRILVEKEQDKRQNLLTPVNFRAAMQHGNDCFQEGNFGGAVSYFTDALKRRGDSRVVYANRSAALLGMGRVEEALADALTCTELSPGWLKGWIRKANALTALVRPADAKEAYEEALRLEPCSDEIRNLLQSVRSDLAVVLAKPPPVGIPKVWKSEVNAGWSLTEQCDKGNAAFRRGEFKVAAEIYSTALKYKALRKTSQTEHRTDIQIQAKLHSNRAAAYIGLGQLSMALADSNKSTVLMPEYAKGWARKCTALAALKRDFEARNAHMIWKKLN